MHTLTSTETMTIRLGNPKTARDCAWRISYWDAALATAALVTEGSVAGSTNGTSQVTMLSAPSAGNVRHARSMSMLNGDSASITVEIAIGAAFYKASLNVGDILHMNEKTGWTVSTASGAIKMALGSASWGTLTGDLADQIDLAAELDTKVDRNTTITESGLTNKIVQYDSKGLVLSGVDATTASIPDSVDKRYVTDSQKDAAGRTHLALSTGLLTGCVLSVDSGDPTKIHVTDGVCQYVDNSNPSEPVVETLVVTAASAAPVVAGQGLDALFLCWCGIARQSAGVGALVFSPEFSETERRVITVLGRTWAVAIGSSTIAAATNYQTPAWGAAKSLEDLCFALGGAVNLDGNVFTAHTGQLTLDKSAGHSFRLFAASGANHNSPNFPLNPPLTPVVAYRYWAVAGTSYGNAASSTIDPDYYDVGGARTAVPAGKWTIQQVYYFSGSATVSIAYGQAYYDTLDEARTAGLSQVVTFSDLATRMFHGGLFRSRIYIQQGATDLAGAYIESLSAFVAGGTGSGGGTVSDHAILSHLDYTSAGHTGFVPASRTVAGRALSADVTLAKGDVGLGNVDNVSDASKPISAATQTALDLKLDAADTSVVKSSSNAGLTGVGITLDKDGADLPFRSISGDGIAIAVDEDETNHAIKISYTGPTGPLHTPFAYRSTTLGLLTLDDAYLDYVVSGAEDFIGISTEGRVAGDTVRLTFAAARWLRHGASVSSGFAPLMLTHLTGETGYHDVSLGYVDGRATFQLRGDGQWQIIAGGFS